MASKTARRARACAQRATLEHFSVEALISLHAGDTLAAACATPHRGGSDVLYRSDHVRAIVDGHGHLQSAGNASWPLYCPAGQLRRAFLSGTRGTCLSFAPQEKVDRRDSDRRKPVDFSHRRCPPCVQTAGRKRDYGALPWTVEHPLSAISGRWDVITRNKISPSCQGSP